MAEARAMVNFMVAIVDGNQRGNKGDLEQNYRSELTREREVSDG
jgi:hypothetical protein